MTRYKSRPLAGEGQGCCWALRNKLVASGEKIKTSFQSAWAVVRSSPGVLLYPLLIGAVLVAVGLWAVCYAAQKSVADSKDLVRNVAHNAATQYVQQLLAACAPVDVLAASVEVNPQFTAVNDQFKATAPLLLLSSPAVFTLQMVPAGVVSMVAPAERTHLFLGRDTFDSTDPAYVKSLVDTLEAPGIVMEGPFQQLFGVHDQPVLVVRKAIYVHASSANETFGRPNTTNPVCGRLCDYNATSQMAFWGFASATVMMDGWDVQGSSLSLSPLLSLQDLGLRYTLTAANGLVMAATPQPPRHALTVPVTLPGKQWVLAVGPPGSWSPAWLPGVVVVVVVCGALAAGLLFGVLLSRRRHEMLLEALLPPSVIQGLHKQHAATQLGKRDVCYDSPAELLHGVLEALLCGSQPDLRDVVLLRTLLLNNAPWYSPVDAGGKIRAANLDSDVARALMRQLGNATDDTSSETQHGHDGSTARGGVPRIGDAPELVHTHLTLSADEGQNAAATGPFTQRQQYEDSRCHDLHGALELILNPSAMATDPNISAACPLATATATALLSSGIFETGACLDTARGDPVPLGFTDSLGSGYQDRLLRKGPRPESPCSSAATPTTARGTPYDLGGAACILTTQDVHEHMRAQVPQPQRSSGGGSGSPAAKVSLGRRLLQTMLPVGKFASVQRAAVTDGLGTSSGGSFTAGCVRPAASTASAIVLSLTGSTVTALPAHGSIARAGGEAAGDGPPRTAATLDGFMPMGPGGAPPGGLQGSPCLVLPGGALGGSKDAGGDKSCIPLTLRHALPCSSTPATPINEWEGFAGREDAAYGTAARGMVARIGLSGPKLDAVERLLCCVDGLRYDTWALDAATGGHALSALGFFLLQREGLLARFSLPPSRVIRLLHALEAGYPANPYHSAVHAADVLRSLHVLLHGARLRGHYLDDLGLLAAYFAAAVHDHGHPGLTGDFLVATSHPLALRYNDRSPLESHHAASAFELLAARPDLDITEGMSREDKAAFRKQVIEMVLATDMKQHFAIMGQFTATAHRRKEGQAGQEGCNSRSIGAGGRATGAEGSGSGKYHAAAGRPRRSMALTDGPPTQHCTSTQQPTPIDEAEKMLSLQVALKVADIGHLSGELGVHKRWLGVLEEEFFRQGDRERQLGLPISPLFDRAKQGVSKSQVGFFDFVALPLVRAFASAFPGAQPMAACFEVNYRHWVEEQAQAQEEAQQQGGGKHEHERKSDQAGKQENKQDGQQGARPGDGDRSSRTKAFMRLSSRLG